MQIPYYTTRLEFYWCNSQVRIDVLSRESMRARRAVLLLFYRRLEKLLQKANCIRLFHLERPKWEPDMELCRAISLHQAPEGHTEAGLLGFEIRMRRLELGMTQKDLAHKAEVSRTHISRIEKGRHEVSSLTLERICKALDPFGKTVIDAGLSTHQLLRQSPHYNPTSIGAPLRTFEEESPQSHENPAGDPNGLSP